MCCLFFSRCAQHFIEYFVCRRNTRASNGRRPPHHFVANHALHRATSDLILHRSATAPSHLIGSTSPQAPVCDQEKMGRHHRSRPLRRCDLVTTHKIVFLRLFFIKHSTCTPSACLGFDIGIYNSTQHI
jgi:hypothetical protein